MTLDQLEHLVTLDCWAIQVPQVKLVQLEQLVILDQPEAQDFQE